MAERGKWDRRVWPQEIAEFVKKNASDNVTIKHMQEMIFNQFGAEYTYEQMKGYYHRNRIPFKPNYRSNILLTDEQAEYLISIIPGLRSDEIVKKMNEQFGLELTIGQIRTWKKNHKVPSGYDARFRKGHESRTKGAKWDDFMSPDAQKNSLQTCFKKGNVPKNKVPVGTVSRRGEYLWIKVRDNCGPKNFMLYHRYIWEKANGPVPDGYKLFFLDGNPFNCKLENLKLVKESVMVIANQKYGTTSDPEINEMILNAAQLKLAVASAMKKRKG